MVMVQLRDYQKQIANQATAILQSSQFVYLALEVRTGKTLTSLQIASQCGATSVLFVTKKKAIASIQSDYDKLAPGYSLEIVNYESLHKVNMSSLSLIILDESHCCFIGDTIVDGKKIKDIRLGDYLKSFNFESGKYEHKKVINVFKNELTENLIKIKCNGKEIICTESHEIYTKKGWIKASEITTKDELQIL
jgi:hypothetical protein